MYRIVLVFTVVFVSLIMSCTSEEEEQVACSAPFITENLVGSWNVQTSESSTTTSVTFLSDGTGTEDSEDGPFSYYCRLNDEVIKDFIWRQDPFGDTENIYLKYKNQNCTQDNGYLLLSNDCDKIEFSAGTFLSIVLTRG